MDLSKQLFFCFILVFYSCIRPERSDRIEYKEIILSKTDTVYVYLDRPEKNSEKFEKALKEYLGVKELTGNNDGEIIEKILASCGISIPAPWCACYLNQGLLDIGKTGPDTIPGWSPQWFKDPERITWTRERMEQLISKGNICGIYFRSKRRVAHVLAVLDDFGDGYVLTIEGNTNDQGSREGNKVAIRLRHKSELYICSNWLDE